MSGCLEAPSPILLQYATLGVIPVHKRRPTPPVKESPGWSRPYQFIYRMTQRCKNVINRPEPEEDQKPDVDKLASLLEVKYRQKNEGVAPDAVVVHNAGDQSAHLSDVFDVISANDPTFGAGAAEALPRDNMAQAPYAFIIEQPAPKSLRFRYECEGRSAGSIPGVNTTAENKTFPTIKICGYKGCMVIVVSCVTKEEPYKPHPHNLVGRDCQMGVCTVKVKTEGEQDSCHVTFKNLGIQCVKRRDIPEALRVRRELRVNPFKTGYAHQSQPQSIDLNAVRLCFQVFLTDESYKVQRALTPVVSEIIYDKKAMSDLLIVRTSHCAGTVKGGTTIILLCEKVTREDTEVYFFREENGVEVWRDRGHIEFVHKQLAIVLKTPPYADQRINEHVQVQIQLQRVSDGAKSNAFIFEYFPEAQDKEDILSRKRPKKIYNLQEYDGRPLAEMAIKAEPRDRTPPHPMSVAYGDQQWRVERAGPPAAYAWGSPSYGRSPEPVQLPPDPHHVQMMSPEAHGSAALGAPGSPYAMHMLSPHMMHQPGTSMHMQNMGVRSPHAVSVSPAMSPNMMHGMQSTLPPSVSPGMQGTMSPGMQGTMSPGMQGTMSPGMQGTMSPGIQGTMSPGMQGTMSPGMQASMSPGMQQGMQPSMLAGVQCTMDPIMAEPPIYTQMDASVSTPSLATLLAQHGDEDVQLTSGELSSLLLGERDRADLSDSLTRLSTRDLLQP